MRFHGKQLANSGYLLWCGQKWCHESTFPLRLLLEFSAIYPRVLDALYHRTSPRSHQEILLYEVVHFLVSQLVEGGCRYHLLFFKHHLRVDYGWNQLPLNSFSRKPCFKAQNLPTVEVIEILPTPISHAQHKNARQYSASFVSPYATNEALMW